MRRAAAQALFCAALLDAAVLDTTLRGNGGPGPYSLGSVYIDSQSITVEFAGGENPHALPFAYIGAMNAILFSAPIDSQEVFRVTGAIRYPGLSKIHALYEKAYLAANDSAAARDDSLQSRKNASSLADEELQVAGYKSVSISVGSRGQANLEQELDVTITGRIADSAQLRGHLSDQGSSLEGATREISEIDMIYLTITHPRATATVGDQYLRWPAGGMLFGEKKVKGVSAKLTLRNFSIGGFGALSGGSFASQTMRGQAGLQGPYFLTGAGESPFITPLGGTVSVWVNGAKLREGDDADYQVNYDFGSITFTPQMLVKDGDIIRAEYEYKVFDYQRSMFGADLGAVARDSILSFRGALWYEGDNARHPIDLGDLTQDDRDSLAVAGDRVYLKAMMAYPVNPNDADSVASYTGLYVKERDSLGREFFAWAPDARVNRQLYRVPFRRVEDNRGEYADSLVCPHGSSGLCYSVYRFVGSGGNYSARAPLPAPRRTINGEAFASLRPAKWASLSLDVAGQETDRNTLSAKDDEDNRGAATRTALEVGERRTDAPALWLRGQHQFISRQFSADILLASHRRTAWNDTALAQAPAAQQLWEAAVGAAFVPQVTTEFSYGQRWRDSLITDRAANATSATLHDIFTLRYDGALFRHFDAAPHARSRRNHLRLSLDYPRAGLWIGVGDEWWWAQRKGRGNARGEIGFSYKPWQVREAVIVVSDRAGSCDLFSADTGWSLVWQQALDHAIVPGWNLRGSSAYNARLIRRPQQRTTSTLIDLASEVTAGTTGFSTTQRYALSSERASIFIQQPKYVGPGLGTHVIDTTLGGDRYVPKAGGDWIIAEREVSDSSAAARVRKSALEVAWTFAPNSTKLAGILADLSWRGAGRITEHVRAGGATPWTAWIPGYTSLAPGEAPLDFSDLSYRQTIDWRPKAAEGLYSQLFVRPFQKTVRSYRERGAEWGGRLDKKWERWFVGAETRFLHLFHQAAYANYRLKDRWIELTEKRFFPLDFEVYIAEAVGWAEKTPSLGRGSGWYYGLRPGAAWTPARKGRADASYSLSKVLLNELDYRMARGLPAGLSHIIDVMADIAVGDRFLLNASYRGEITRPIDGKEYLPGIHVISAGVKAYL